MPTFRANWRERLGATRILAPESPVADSKPQPLALAKHSSRRLRARDTVLALFRSNACPRIDEMESGSANSEKPQRLHRFQNQLGALSTLIEYFFSKFLGNSLRVS